MKILMTADAVGGVFDYMASLASELTARGARVHVATMGPAMRVEQRARLGGIRGVTVHESTYELEWMDDPWREVARAAEWLRALERTIRPDVEHLNGYAHGDAGFSAPVVIVGHSCVLSWWEAVHRRPAPPRYGAYAQAVRRGLAAATLVISPTEAMLRALERHYGALRRAVVIPNGLPARSVPTPAIASKEPVVLSAGRVWDPAKNIAALSRIARRLPWPVAVAGSVDGPGRAPVALDGVRVLGWLPEDELFAQMDRAAVFAIPARYEPFGLSALQAASRACALVLGDIPSQREVWGEAALFVDPDDDDAIAAAIERLTSDDALRSDLASRAARRAAAMTAERTATNTMEAYAAASARASASEERTQCV